MEEIKLPDTAGTHWLSGTEDAFQSCTSRDVHSLFHLNHTEILLVLEGQRQVNYDVKTKKLYEWKRKRKKTKLLALTNWDSHVLQKQQYWTWHNQL